MQRRRTLERSCALVALALSPGFVAAQQSPGSALTDSLARRARIAGEEAANSRGIEGRAALGFVGGATFGFFVVPAAVGAPVGYVFGGTGLVLVGAAVGVEGAPPDSVVSQGDAYARVYVDAFNKRWGQRRRKAGLLGGAAGAVTGFAAFVWLLSIALDDY